MILASLGCSSARSHLSRPRDWSAQPQPFLQKASSPKWSKLEQGSRKRFRHLPIATSEGKAGNSGRMTCSSRLGDSGNCRMKASCQINHRRLILRPQKWGFWRRNALKPQTSDQDQEQFHRRKPPMSQNGLKRSEKDWKPMQAPKQGATSPLPESKAPAFSAKIRLCGHFGIASSNERRTPRKSRRKIPRWGYIRRK